MTKSKLKQLTLDCIQQYLEEGKDDILDIISNDAVDIDEDGETVSVDAELIEEAYDSVIANLF